MLTEFKNYFENLAVQHVGIKGQMAVDATYLYICVDTDTWARVALAW